MKQGQTKLADFAMSSDVIVETSTVFTNRSSAAVGTDAYSAPEVIDIKGDSLSTANGMTLYSFVPCDGREGAIGQPI